MIRTTVKGWPRNIAAETRVFTERAEFRTSGSLKGIDHRVWQTGQLPHCYAETFRADAPTYTILSYSTPIAWYGARGWVVPDTSYSVTTTIQQNKIRSGITMAGLDYLNA